MIYSLTPNPTLDLGGRVKEVIANEKAYVYQESLTPGGNAINAGRIAQRLGSRVRTAGFLGGQIGEQVADLLARENLEDYFTRISGTTRINVTVTEDQKELQTRLSFPGPRIRKNEWTECFRQALKENQRAVFLLGGSLPPGVSEKKILKLVSCLRKQGRFVFLDLPQVKTADLLKARPSVIKPNLIELQAYTGRKLTSIEEVVQAVSKWNKFIDYVCVSSVEGGALLVSTRGVWFGKTPRVPVRTTVGAGDSMVGAMAYYVSNQIFHRQGIDSEQMLRWGLSGAAATLIQCPMQLGSKRDIHRFRDKILIRKLF